MYWFLIELLRNSNGYKAELDYANLCKLAQVRNKLVIPSILNDFNLFTSLHNMFWSERLMRDMQHMEGISAKARISVYQRHNKKRVDGIQQISSIFDNYTNRSVRR